MDHLTLLRDTKRIALLADTIYRDVGKWNPPSAFTIKWVANEAMALAELARKLSADAESELARRAGQWTPE